MLSIQPFGFASDSLSGYRVVPPHIASRAHVAGGAGTPIDNHFLYRFAPFGQRLVDCSFEFDRVAAAPPGISRNHELRAGVFDSILDGVRGTPAEYHRVHCAD